MDATLSVLSTYNSGLLSQIVQAKTQWVNISTAVCVRGRILCQKNIFLRLRWKTKTFKDTENQELSPADLCYKKILVSLEGKLK